MNDDDLARENESRRRRADPEVVTIAEEGSLTLPVHNCRHTLASHGVMSGLDLYTVDRLLGHADIGSTERYAHLADEHVREAAGRISGIVSDA